MNFTQFFEDTNDMTARACFLLAFIVTSVNLLATASNAEEPSKVNFSKQVRPILNKHCTACHGGVKQAADVSFVYRDQVVAPEGWIVEPGEPDESELVARIVSDDPDDRMPPPEHGHGLDEEEVALVKQWIEEGANWGKHWAYEAPAKPVIEVDQSGWCRNSIDQFVIRKLKQQSVEPSPAARPERWLRRVTLDLIGLPPSPEERIDFLARIKTDGDAAYEEVVDRLLASPQYGERWASVWLDQVRYADSKGLGLDSPRNIWKYRDWVIDSINDDLPFDQFTIKQIAGDLIPNHTIEDLIATAGHRLTQTNEEGGTDDEEFRIAAVLDRVSTTWQTWQGVTFSCVQCHSHPYDPIKHEEFYEFAAFFNNTSDCDLNKDWPTINVPIDTGDYEKATMLDRQIESLREKIWKQEFSVVEQDLWQPLKGMTASTNKPTKIVVERNGERDEFHTVDTISKHTDISIESPLPEDIESLTAIRLTALPLSPKKAVSDSEWGFVLAHIEATLLLPGQENPRDIKLSYAISDEAHPFMDPSKSLNPQTNEGFSAYTRIHYPRTVAFVLAEPIDIPAGSKIRVELKHRHFILASFSLMIRRGHLAVSSSDQFSALAKDQSLVSSKAALTKRVKQRGAIRSTSLPVLREREERFSRPSHVFIRGLFLTKDKLVTPDTPESFHSLPADRPADRLALAQWLVSENNTLTARVAVNRLWAQLFGIGLVATEEDFGSSGDPPSHPELLDYLAVRYQTDYAWSTKKIVREMVLSSTYRQSAKIRPVLRERDPQNRWLASGPRFRLPAETIRDQALAVSGLLNLKMAGPPVRPPIPTGVWKPFAGGDKWVEPSKDDPNRYRRAIYTYTKRSIPYPMFASFDSPSREFCTPRRLRSNTPIQALMTLNDKTMVECASAFATRMLQSGDTLEEQIAHGFLLATNRKPLADELDELVGLAKTSDDTGSPLAAVAAVLLNLDEVLMK